MLSLIIAKNSRLKILISFMQFNVMILVIWLIFFWVDVQSRIVYHYYGDVVTFDAAYNSNKYDMDTCFPLGKLCSKLLDIKCINLNSPMSRNSSDQQMDTY